MKELLIHLIYALSGFWAPLYMASLYFRWIFEKQIENKYGCHKSSVFYKLLIFLTLSRMLAILENTLTIAE